MIGTINDYLSIAILVACLANLTIVPYWIISKLMSLAQKVDWLQICVDVIDENIRGEDDDPDPGDEDDEPSTSNVIAIGKNTRSAA